ncbi:ABC transporter substrate-binding protein [Gulosibacter sp. 10]|uniref:ABC transporter substrate-binding protein n=1 Tax=Gulosibacter sp. 10 TaxID=1255570 RepID=UPI00097F3FEA|nr:ABC transporter substrate-binding protein [Gulosibacter sp. 10]SJM54531.1 ABC-type nitrate/sulfonate/bicarbonate transport systems periplasmic components-like protein [Gulosibacter sp. 10]
MPFPPRTPIRALARAVTAALALGATAAAAGCAQAEAPESIRVGVVALGQIAVDHAAAEGYFEGALAGVEVEIVQYPSGATAIPALVAGDLDFLYSNDVSAGLAISQGLDLRLVAGVDAIGPEYHQVITASSGGVQSVADLEGRTVAVNALHSLAWLGVQVALREEGADAGSVSFTEVEFPEMSAVMQRGDVAAAEISQPWGEEAIASGEAVPLFDFADYEQLDGLPVASYYTSGAFAEAQPEAVAAFDAGVDLALEDMRADRDLVADLAVQAAGSTPEAAAVIADSILFVPEQPAAETQRVYDLMLEFDMLETPLDAERIAVG